MQLSEAQQTAYDVEVSARMCDVVREHGATFIVDGSGSEHVETDVPGRGKVQIQIAHMTLDSYEEITD